MEKIESLQNARVKRWARLKKKKNRDSLKRFLVEGEHLVQEALLAGIVETIIFDTEISFDFNNCIQVTADIMHKLSSNVSEVHLIAVCKQHLLKADNPMKRVLILDAVQDPGNLGTLIRTAVSFSFDAVFCSLDSCDLYNEKTIRSTQGAMFHIAIRRVDILSLIKDLKKQNFTVVATALHDSIDLQTLSNYEKMAFILGNEGQGVSKEVYQKADYRVKIEMSGFESLNVAIAGGIVMYQFRK